MSQHDASCVESCACVEPPWVSVRAALSRMAVPCCRSGIKPGGGATGMCAGLEPSPRPLLPTAPELCPCTDCACCACRRDDERRPTWALAAAAASVAPFASPPPSTPPSHAVNYLAVRAAAAAISIVPPPPPSRRHRSPAHCRPCRRRLRRRLRRRRPGRPPSRPAASPGDARQRCEAPAAAQREGRRGNQRNAHDVLACVRVSEGHSCAPRTHLV